MVTPADARETPADASADARSAPDAGILVVPEGAELAATSAVIQVPLGLARCVTARLLLPDGSTRSVGVADGLVSESSMPEVAEARTDATPIGSSCAGLVVAGLGEGAAALTLRVLGHPELGTARVSATVVRPSEVRFTFNVGSREVVGVGRETCGPRLTVLVDGRPALALLEAVTLEFGDSTVVSGRLDARGALCLRGERPATSTLRVVHSLGAATYSDTFTVDVKAWLNVESVQSLELPPTLAPGACADLTEWTVTLEYRGDDGSFGTFDNVPIGDPRVTCSAEGPLSLTEGTVCVEADAPPGSVVSLRCCMEGVCSPSRALVWAATPGDRISVDPRVHTHVDVDRVECVPVRVDISSTVGLRIDISRTGLVTADAPFATGADAWFNDDGTLCYRYPYGAAEVPVAFGVADRLTWGDGVSGRRSSTRRTFLDLERDTLLLQ